MIRTAFKMAPVDKQIEALKNNPAVKHIEIQLLGNDDLDKIYKVKDKVISIHTALNSKVWEELGCNLSNIILGVQNDRAYYDKLTKVAKDCGAVIVCHGDPAVRQLTDKQLNEFVKFAEEKDVRWYVENSSMGNNPMADLAYPPEICRTLNSKLEKSLFFPLLDICHYQISSSQFDTNITWNLKETLANYCSDTTFIHLNEATGCGRNNQGGIHGSCFRHNLPLLKEIIDYIKTWDVNLILEVAEKDNCVKENAEWLNDRVHEFLENKN